MIVVIRDLIKGIGVRDVIGDDASVGVFIVMGDDCTVGLLPTCVVIIVPCFRAFGDVEVDREGGHASIIIKILLIIG